MQPMGCFWRPKVGCRLPIGQPLVDVFGVGVGWCRTPQAGRPRAGHLPSSSWASGRATLTTRASSVAAVGMASFPLK